MLWNFFKRIETDKTPLAYWLASFFAIILLRNLLEGVLGGNHEVIKASSFFISLVLPYIFLFLALVIILRFITREKASSIMKVLVVLFALLLVVPIIDFFAYGGRGAQIIYLSGDASQMAGNFLTYYSTGATVGQRVEGLAFGLLLLLYLFTKTKSAPKVLAGLFLAYCMLFVFAALSPIALGLSNLLFGSPAQVGVSLQSVGYEKGLYVSYISGLLTVLLSSLLIALEAAILLAICSQQKFLLLLRAIRLVRSAHYMLLAIFGVLLGVSATQSWRFGFYNFFSFGYVVAVFFAHQFACLINDFFDRDLHVRVKSKQSEGDWHTIKLVSLAYLILALATAYPSGYESTVFLICTAVLAFLYSAPPVRLKRFPIVASATLALLALLVVLGGFAVFAKDRVVELFPQQIAVAILLVYTLGTNYKDLKGIELDKKDKVYTIPVLLGEKKGKIIVGVMTVLSFLLVPFILGIPDLLLPSAVAGLLSVFVIAKNADEKLFRAMHLCYLVLVLSYLIK